MCCFPKIFASSWRAAYLLGFKLDLGICPLSMNYRYPNSLDVVIKLSTSNKMLLTIYVNHRFD